MSRVRMVTWSLLVVVALASPASAQQRTPEVDPDSLRQAREFWEGLSEAERELAMEYFGLFVAPWIEAAWSAYAGYGAGAELPIGGAPAGAERSGGLWASFRSIS